MKYKQALVILGILIVGAAAWLLAQNRIKPVGSPAAPVAPFGLLAHLAAFTENGVEVEVNLEKDDQGGLLLAATYTPVQPHFHLYGKELPPKGIEGVGRPTRLNISSDGLETSGLLYESVPALEYNIAGFDRPFPLYPAGPVTLRLPVTFNGSPAKPITVQVFVTYMACSTQGVCLPPVVNKSIPVTIPLIRS